MNGALLILSEYKKRYDNPSLTAFGKSNVAIDFFEKQMDRIIDDLKGGDPDSQTKDQE
jgi:hypothetical protein